MQNAFRVAQTSGVFLRHTVIVAEVNVYQAVARLYGLARFSLISGAGSQFASPRKGHTRREAGPQSQESRRCFTRSSGCRRKIERSDARSDRRTEFQAATGARADDSDGAAARSSVSEADDCPDEARVPVRTRGLTPAHSTEPPAM